MSYLVLGAGGQLGTEWCRRLDELDLQFAGYGSKELDIMNPEALQKAMTRLQPEVVVNCAAYTKVDQAEEEPDRARSINATAVRPLAEMCRDFRARLVHYSTDYVFPGRKQDRDRYPKGYPEDAAVDPINVYGQTKWEGEQAIRECGGKHLIVRVSWLCGAHGGNFVKTMLRLADERDELKVVNDQFGSPTFTADVVQHTLSLLEQEVSGTVHVTSRGIISWYVFALAIMDLSGKNVNIRPVGSSQFPTRAQRPAFSKLDTYRLERHVGDALTTWKTGLRKLLEEMQS